ncbi:acetolactate synthase-1/2/3 large subunit [Devosia subaequoris]|uniref:Acetolactate synthase-1/2/3 large subunit n=1 Tax=Devosia subaequoris TaxID=395930 RepID=A0A7W6IQI8_9HYPH|nr:thiamine pyrophosphate-binding protein [Devosia subaequoris]MBB4053948.1 acetolactate synthase-1/2/3 large subunit [Devosia subaequoris]MCP1211452.1 thiamine pyrophosphate-binding protein [Devosia subaequoris]
MSVEITSMTRRGGDLLVASLLANRVDRAFCVPGESYLPVLDALHDVSDQIDLVVCRHESGASNMAEAYGKLTGRPGVCFVTRGPGATHASIGVHTAFQDSTPLVMFVGQVNSSMKDREGFQEVDFAAMFSPLVKWAAEINDPSRIPEYVHRAFQTAMAGRPGPVVLALPEDVLSTLVSDDIDPGLCAEPVNGAPTAAQLDMIADLVEAAERPLLIVGGGDWQPGLGEQVASFAERFGVTVAASLRCQDYVSNHHPNYVGHLTIGAEPKLIERVRQADLLIVMGARLGEMTTAGYTILDPAKRGATLVHIYPDPEELGRVYQANLAINAGAPAIAAGLAALTPKATSEKRSQWVADCRAEYLATLEVADRDTTVDLARIVTDIRNAVPADTIVCSGAGNYTAWAHRFWQFSNFRTQLAPTSGAMGYGVPAAIAASLVHPDRTVVCFAGDGCFQMSSQELATAAQYGAKILFVVVNNSMLGTIRMHQEREFPERVYATDLVNPDFVALAKAYGLMAERVEKTADFGPALARALAAPGSALLELITEKDAISHRTTITAMRAKAKAAKP